MCIGAPAARFCIRQGAQQQHLMVFVVCSRRKRAASSRGLMGLSSSSSKLHELRSAEAEPGCPGLLVA